MKQQRIARARVFGPTPEVVAHRLTYTLNHLEEEPKPMKKGISIILVVAIILALTGVSLALARNTGVLDFLFPGQPAPTPLHVQTVLPQVGGDEMERLIVEVRDAVSDGTSIHISAAFSVRTPEKEAVLKSFDELFIYELDGMKRTPIDEAMEGVGFRRPFVSKVKDKEIIYIVDCLYTLDGPYQLANTNWLYESPSVLVVDYIIDLRGASYVDGSPVQPQSPLASPLLVRLIPQVRVINDDGKYELVEQGDIHVVVTHTTLETSAYAAANLPIAFESFTLTAARFTVTPIGVYADYEFFDPLEEPGATRFFSAERSLVFGLFDQNDVGISPQTNSEPRIQYGPEGKYVSRALYPVMDIPETVKVRPYELICEDGQWDERFHQPVTLYLEPVE